MVFKKTLLALSMLGLVSVANASASFDFVNDKAEVKSDLKSENNAQTHVVFINDVNNLDGAAAIIDEQSNGRLSKLLALNKFDAKLGNTQHFQMLGDIESLLVVGSQQEDSLSVPDLQNLGGKISSSLSSTKERLFLTIHIDNIVSEVKAPSAYLAQGYNLRHYSFDKYKTQKSEGSSNVTFVSEQATNAKTLYESDLQYVAQGVHMARDFATEPGKTIYPQAFVDAVKQKFKKLDVDISVLDVKDMKKYNMGALMGVGKGSVHDPRLIVIEYMGGNKEEAPIVLAGKGITFDTGGISIKGNSGMWAMKSDLSGAAAVAGTMYAIAQRGENANVIGIMAMAENMPSADAIRPGDVLETMKGTTIEIMSTDAEGRLVLADAVYYAQQKYNPDLLVNIATLTGSAARALSDEYGALITRDFDLSVEMMGVGERSGENVWPLPLHPNHFEQIKSPIADIKNSGAGNPGASIGAAVIGTFIDEDLAWVHLDIAGVDWLESPIDVAPKGSQGWGVRFMDQIVRERAAK